METCDLCGKRVCPVCLTEADCCFEDADDHDGDSTWAPNGWHRVPSQTSETVWERAKPSEPPNAAGH